MDIIGYLSARGSRSRVSVRGVALGSREDNSGDVEQTVIGRDGCTVARLFSAGSS